MWSIDLAGHVRAVARMPRFRDRRLLAGGASTRLVALVPADENASSAGWLLVAADLTSGKTYSRRVTELRDVPPSPLSADESLICVSSRVVALDWREARMRFLTWPVSGSSAAHLIADGTWACAGAVFGSPVQEALCAVNMADGRAHVVLARDCFFLAAAPSGASFLASRNVDPSSSLSSPGAELLEIFPDFSSLARAPVFKEAFVPIPRH